MNTNRYEKLVKGIYLSQEKNGKSSSPGDFHPQALTETDVTVSRHPALIIAPPVLSLAVLPYHLAPPISG